MLVSVFVFAFMRGSVGSRRDSPNSHNVLCSFAEQICAFEPKPGCQSGSCRALMKVNVVDTLHQDGLVQIYNVKF